MTLLESTWFFKYLKEDSSHFSATWTDKLPFLLSELGFLLLASKWIWMKPPVYFPSMLIHLFLYKIRTLNQDLICLKSYFLSSGWLWIAVIRSTLWLFYTWNLKIDIFKSSRVLQWTCQVPLYETQEAGRQGAREPLPGLLSHAKHGCQCLCHRKVPSHCNSVRLVFVFSFWHWGKRMGKGR